MDDPVEGQIDRRAPEAPLSGPERVLQWLDVFVPGPEARPDIVLKQRMLVGCAVVLACAAVGFGAHAWRLQEEIGGITAALWVGAGLALCAPLWLRATGSVVLPGTFICVEFALLVGIVSLFGNGVDGAVLIWAPAIPLLAAFLVDARASIGLALWTAAEVAFLFWLDVTGHGPPDAFNPEQLSQLRFVALVSGIGFAAFLGWLYESQTLRGLRRVNRDLRAAKEKAEASEQAKGMLLMNMSHEVRTPLTSILGAAEILKDEASAELTDLADVVLAGSRRMFDTLTTVLDLAHLDGDGHVLHREPFDLGECLHAAAEAMRPAAHGKGLAVEIATTAPVVVEADPVMTRRILGLLLDNAVKFTETGGVTVRIEAGATMARVDVADTGVGMSAAFVPRAFEAFQQESEGMARSHEGSGLGLTLARRLAVLQGGTLTAESRKGEGSTFSLTLPLAGPDGHPASSRRAVAAAPRPPYRIPGA